MVRKEPADTQAYEPPYTHKGMHKDVDESDDELSLGSIAEKSQRT